MEERPVQGKDGAAYRLREVPRCRRLPLRGLEESCVREWGPEGGLPVFLLHGWMDSGATWQFVVDVLLEQAPSCRLIAPDWRGFGDSAWCAHGYWFPDYLADLEALLEALAPGKEVVLVGHSMGGNVAGLYAGIRPERVRALALLEGFGLPEHRPEEAPRRYRAWFEQLSAPPALKAPDSIEEFALRLCQRHPNLPLERARFVADSWLRLAPDGRLAFRADPRHKILNPILYRLEEAKACWRAITAPCLWLWGEESEIPRQLAADWEARKACFRRWEGRTIAKAGHMMHHEQPEAVAQALGEFIARTVRIPG
jgi:pimeloyl-ACP methyl ester carboxylesterase